MAWTRARLRFWWESGRFTNAAEFVRLPLGALLFAAYLVTAIALVLPYETPARPMSVIAHADTWTLVGIAAFMGVLHGLSMFNILTGWGRKLVYLLSAGVWAGWSSVLYQGGRHIGSAYAALFAFGALAVYWQLPTRGELRSD